MSKTEKEHEQILLFDDFPSVSKESWKKETEKRVSYKDLIWHTEDGIEVEPFYTEEEARDFFLGETPLPGEFPFVRGTGKKDNSWLLTEEIRLTTPKETRASALAAIEGGADSLTLIPQAGMKRKAFETLLKDIDPLRTGINFALREDPEKACALFISSCAKKGIDTRELRGAVFFDPLSHLLGHRSPATPLDEDVDKIAKAIGYLSGTAPGYAAFSVKSSTFKGSGATITQELAFTIAAAVEYLVMLRQKGVDADSACRHLVFSFSTGSSYFAEIAKLRAARALWANVAQQFSPASAESTKMRIHCRTTAFNKTIYDPHTNILRTALEAMASVIGGADSLTVEPFDAHYREPDGFSRRVARNVQLLSRNESHLDAVTDPGGGSYHIEKLTQSISQKSLELFQEIEKKGGYLECIKSGFIQNAVEDSREKVLSDISRRKKTLVGTNEFPNVLEKMAGDIRKTVPAEEKSNGSAPTVAPLAESRAAQAFEKIRLLSEQYAKRTGEALKVFLLHLSDSPQTVARSVFSMNFFGCGGFTIIDGAENPGIDEGVAAALRENPLAVVICGSDKDYEQFAEEAARELKDKGAEIKVVVPGGGQAEREGLAETGVDDFINADSDVRDMLERYQQLLF
jgi:methylmalonyl-CoA mutase